MTTLSNPINKKRIIHYQAIANYNTTTLKRERWDVLALRQIADEALK